MRFILFALVTVLLTGALSAQSGKKPADKSAKSKTAAPAKKATTGTVKSSSPVNTNAAKLAELKTMLVADPQTPEAKDKNAILQYAIDSALAIQSTPTGLWYVEHKAGTGKGIDMDGTVTTHFTIKSLKGTLYGDSRQAGKPLQIPMVQMGPLAELFAKLKVGAVATFFIPSGPAGINLPEAARMDVEISDAMSAADLQKMRDEMVGKEKESIQNYIKTNNLTGFQATPEGIYYKLDPAGDAANHPTLQSTVKVHYRGTLLDGKQFDSSYDRGEPIEFPLTGVIQGWQKGIPLLGKGGKGTFIIPSPLAYGENSPSPDIPANSVLVFEVELLDIK